MNGIRWWTGVAVVGTTLVVNQFSCSGADDDKTKKENSKSTTSREGDKDRTTAANRAQPMAFLGLMVEELHPAFASHLPGAGVKGQGLLVEDVGNDSPAAKAGIKTHDILMTYDDQKLFVPEQFIKLIHGDKPGREVSLGLIREGKPQTIKAQLGERDAKWDQPHPGHPAEHARHFGFGWPGHGLQNRGEQPQSDSENPTWNSFDSLTLKKLDKDRFRASVAYTDKEGKLQKHEYEGTRDEIRKKIEGDKDLMPNERYHLVRGLDLQDGNFPNFLFPNDHGLDF